MQNKLFTVASILATEDTSKIKHHITETDIDDLEKIIDIYMGRLGNPTGFIVNGSGKKSGHLHVARTVCRRAERRIITLSGIVDIEPLVIKYVNRLSDTLYAMARFSEEKEGSVKY